MSRDLERYNAVVSDRNRWNGLLTDAGKYAWPNAQEMYKTTRTNQGYEYSLNIYDSTAIDAAFRLTANLFGYLMPVGTEWFKLVADTYDDKQNDSIQKWLSIATDVTHAEIWRSNYMREMFMAIRSMVVFGTGVISVERQGDDIVYRSYHIGDVFFEENSKGIIDVVYRRMFFTARQAIQEFGEDSLPVEILDAAKNPTEIDNKFEFFNIVHPNNDFNSKKIDSKKFASKFIFKDKDLVVKKEKFDSQPYLVMRFTKAPDEIMGRGPVIDNLPEIRMLSKMRQTFIEAAELAVRPPMMMEDDGVIGMPVTDPGGTIYLRAGAQFPQPWQTGANLPLTNEVIEDQRSKVNRAMMLDAFQTLEGLRNISSATESQIRKQEGQAIIAPITSAIQKDALDPLIVRTLNLIPPSKLPQAPKDFEFNVSYVGRLALAMDALQADAIEIWLAKWAPYAEAGVFDNIDLDAAARFSAHANAVPAQLISSEEEVGAIRAKQEQQQQAAVAAETGETASKAIKNVSGAVDANSIVANL